MDFSRAAIRLTTVLALLAAAFMAAAGAADAKKHRKKHKLGPIVVRSATGSASGNGAIVSETATCPGKKTTRAIGGGFTGSPPSNSILPLVYESQKVGQRSWRSSAQIADTSGPGSESLTAFVYCRRNAPATTPVATSVPTPDTFQFGPSAGASCTKGKIQAGGFATPVPQNGANIDSILAVSTVSGPASWESEVISDRSSSLTTFAYCAKRKQTLAPVSATVTGQPPTGSVATATATCPSGLPQAGGFSQVPLLDSGGSYFVPFDSHLAGNAWQTSAAHLGTGPQTFSATALCG